VKRLNFLKISAGYMLPIFFSFTSLFAQSQNTCGINGVVLNGETNVPVPEVELSIPDLNFFTTSDSSGSFHFHNVTEGEHEVKISHVAFYKNSVKIKLSPESRKDFVFYIIPKSIEIAPVVVTDVHTHSLFEQHAEIKNVLKGKELEREMGITLANTLKNETGIAVRSMGPAPARPVLRGLGGDRVMISEDNSKTADLSASSPDHAVTVEPFSIEKIEVLRGPKILTQTSTTIGGIVNVVRHDIPILKAEGISGYAGVYGETANKGTLGSFSLEAPVYGINLKGDFTRRNTSDMATPVGTLKNSYSANTSGALGASYVWNDGYLGASYREYDLGYGIPGGFVGAHPNGVDIKLERKQVSVKGKLNYGSTGKEYFDFSMARVYYYHEELEKNLSIGSQFRILNYLGYLNYYHKSYFGWDKGISGISGEMRDFEIGGRVFTPPTKSLRLASYFYEHLSSDNYNLEFSARYEFNKITPRYEDPQSKIGNIRERMFNTYSVSVSGIYELSSVVSIGANLSRSSRVPTIEELFSGGPHLAAYSFEVGNPELNAESGYGAEIFVFHRYDKLYYNISAFANTLDNYIIPRNTGELNYQIFLPIYAYSDVEAAFYGVEYQVEWEFLPGFRLANTGAYTYGEFKESGAPLPQIPPYKGKIELSYTAANLSLFVNTEYAAAQKRVDLFEVNTSGYAVLNVSTQYSLNALGVIHNFSLNMDNVLNKEYRNHLSWVKSIMPEAGRNFRFTYKMYFNIGE